MNPERDGGAEPQTFQIRSGNSGLALYEGKTAREALVLYLGNKVASRIKVELHDDGSASATFEGKQYRAVL